MSKPPNNAFAGHVGASPLECQAALFCSKSYLHGQAEIGTLIERADMVLCEAGSSIKVHLQ